MRTYTCRVAQIVRAICVIFETLQEHCVPEHPSALVLRKVKLDLISNETIQT